MNRNLIRETTESSIAICLPKCIPHVNARRKQDFQTNKNTNYSKCINKRNNIEVHYNKRCLLKST